MSGAKSTRYPPGGSSAARVGVARSVPCRGAALGLQGGQVRAEPEAREGRAGRAGTEPGAGRAQGRGVGVAWAWASVKEEGSPGGRGARLRDGAQRRTDFPTMGAPCVPCQGSELAVGQGRGPGSPPRFPSWSCSEGTPCWGKARGPLAWGLGDGWEPSDGRRPVVGAESGMLCAARSWEPSLKQLPGDACPAGRAEGVGGGGQRL